MHAMALGANVALIVCDTTKGAIVMAHIALPESDLCPERAKVKPVHFADTAVPYVLAELKKVTGVDVTAANAVIKLAGGANVADAHGTFNVGKRNVIAVKKALWKYGLGPRAEDVGGEQSKSVTVCFDGAKVSVTSIGKAPKEI
jgi:chemotaxis protein CheD